MPYYLDDGTCGDDSGWGLGYDIEYCYTVVANGPSSGEACATTLPQLQAFLDLDLSLANAEVAAAYSPFGDLTGDGVTDAVIMVNMVNFFAVDGYQFSFSMDPAIVAAIAAVDGTYIQFAGCVGQAMGMGMDSAAAAAYCEGAGYSSGLESATMGAPGSSGIVMGYSMAGGSVPAGYPGDGGAEGNLLAVIVLNSQYSGTGADVAVTISDFVVSGINPFTGGSVTLNACDADLDPFNGCFDTDTFSTPTADCAGIPAGSATSDSCGVCSGGTSGHVAGSDIDCNGDCFGSATIDSCDECSGGNSGHVADSDQDDCGYCFGINESGSGDVNADASLDVLDIAMIVSHVIDSWYSFDSCELLVGDVDSNSMVNIIDIILIVETIMYGDLARTDEILKAAPSTLELVQHSNSLGYITDKPGLIGFELILSHSNNFSIALNEESFIGDYSTSGNETKIIIVLEGGSELFTTTGKYEIEEMIVGTTNGELLDVTITIIPDEFTLDRAYPNPFNPVTTLGFSLPTQSEVALSIYNLQGREVATLIDANMDAGYHSVVWNADSYSSGVYFVKMVTGEFVNTQKLILVK
jgi:hypothetical protein